MEDGDEFPDENVEELEDEGEEGGAEFPPSRRHESMRPCRPTCNTRLEELATPPRRQFLALWNDHAHHLPKDKVKHLKELLQQLYAMTPEETAKYFAEVRAAAKAAAARRKLKQKLRKFLMEKHHQKQRERAYRLFKRLLRCGIAYAAENPVPPLVSIRLRYLSDIILEQLCDLRKVVLPNRANPDKLGHFLISVADWMAIAVERLYYAAQVSINEMTDVFNSFGDTMEQTMEVPEKFEDLGQPMFQSSAKSLPKVDPYYSFLLDNQPVGTSTPKSQYTQQHPSYNVYSLKPPPSPPRKGSDAMKMPPYSFLDFSTKRASRNSVGKNLDSPKKNKTASKQRLSKASK